MSPSDFAEKYKNLVAVFGIPRGIKETKSKTDPHIPTLLDHMEAMYDIIGKRVSGQLWDEMLQIHLDNPTSGNYFPTPAQLNAIRKILTPPTQPEQVIPEISDYHKRLDAAKAAIAALSPAKAKLAAAAIAAFVAAELKKAPFLSEIPEVTHALRNNGALHWYALNQNGSGSPLPPGA